MTDTLAPTTAKSRSGLHAARVRRNAAMLAAAVAGVPFGDIARDYGLTEKRVRAILRALGYRSPAPADVAVHVEVVRARVAAALAIRRVTVRDIYRAHLSDPGPHCSYEVVRRVVRGEPILTPAADRVRAIVAQRGGASVAHLFGPALEARGQWRRTPSPAHEAPADDHTPGAGRSDDAPGAARDDALRRR